MTKLNTATIAYIARMEASRDICAQAGAEGRVARRECPTWRENALELAGELALVGAWDASRKQAKYFEEGK